MASEAGAVPADHRLRFEDLQSVQHPGHQTVKSNKHQAVNVAQGHSLRGFAPQHIELVSENKDLAFQRSSRPQQSDQGAPDQPENIAHRTEGSTNSRAPVSRFGFTVGTAGTFAATRLSAGVVALITVCLLHDGSVACRVCCTKARTCAVAPDGEDLRERPLEERKATLAKLIAARRPASTWSSMTASLGWRRSCPSAATCRTAPVRAPARDLREMGRQLLMTQA